MANDPIKPPVTNQNLGNAMQNIEARVLRRNVFSIPLEELTPEELQHRRNILESRELERQAGIRELAEGQAEAARKANADNMVLVRAQELANQAACPHIKPRNGGHALAGQKTHRGWYTLVCQYCGKELSSPAQRP